MNDLPWLQKIPWLRLIGVLLLVILLWRLDAAAIVGIMRTANLYLLAVAIILNLPMVLLKSLRWQALMVPQQIRYSAGRAYLAYFGSIFIGFLTPGRLGEFVKAVHIKQDCGVPIGRAISSVLADRLFDLFALLLVGGAALFSLTVGSVKLAAPVGMAALLIIPLVLFLNDASFAFFQQAAFKLGTFGKKLFAEDSWLLELRRGLRQLTWLWLCGAIMLTGLAYLTFFGQCYLLAMSLNLTADFLTVSYAVALGSLVTLLPISISGLGTREAAIVFYLGTAGIAAEAALGFSLSVFLTFYIGGGLIGAIAWWVKPVSLNKAPDSV